MKIIIKKLIYFLFSGYTTIKLNRKISLIYKSLVNIRNIPSNNLIAHEQMWKALGSKPNLKWYKTYFTINGIDKPEYISETIYYNKVELILNNRTFSEAYCDKNFYHRYIDNDLLPFIYLRNIQGNYYSNCYKIISGNFTLNDLIPKEANRVIVKKAIDSGGGRGVDLFIRKSNCFQNITGQVLTRQYLELQYGKNFIVQEFVSQHEYYSQLNQTSVNTIRILTYRSVATNKIIPLQSVLRVGMKGSIVDNQASGGIACGINKDGKLNSFAINKGGNIFYKINEIPICEIPPVYKFNDVLKYAIELASLNFYHRLIGFDFCVDNTGKVKLIEINNRNNEINFYQMNNGPLFREYTDEIIQFCSKNAKNICFDFEV